MTHSANAVACRSQTWRVPVPLFDGRQPLGVEELHFALGGALRALFDHFELEKVVCQPGLV
jgi:hypothetical protein